MGIGLAYGTDELSSVKLMDAPKEGAEVHPATECLIRGAWFCDRFLRKFHSLRCRDIKCVLRDRPLGEGWRFRTREQMIELENLYHRNESLTCLNDHLYFIPARFAASFFFSSRSVRP